MQKDSDKYYATIRKKYRAMRWSDKSTGRHFGFSNLSQVIHYYLENGKPRPCVYCGRLPDAGKVWGLDRVDSTLGHIPGNLVPACGSHPVHVKLSCQFNKSNLSLRDWLEMNMTRTYGHQIPRLLVDMRMTEVLSLAKELGDKKEI